MRTITLQSLTVLTDGGTREGRLVVADGHLAAVLTQVTAEETAGTASPAGGWFLEAGFGPCSSVMTDAPPVFASLDEAVAWVRGQLQAPLP